MNNTIFFILFGIACLIALIIMARIGMKKQTAELMARIDHLKDRVGWEEVRKSINGKPKKAAENIIQTVITKFELIDGLDKYSSLFNNIPEVKKQIESFAISEVRRVINDIERHKELIEKYGEEIADKLVKREYFLGMTEEQLIDCKGRPTNIEREEMKTKTKVIYIYGNKSSGDIFVFVNGELERFKDR